MTNISLYVSAAEVDASPIFEMFAEAVVTVLLVATATRTSVAQATGPMATTKYGKIQGVYENNAAVFHGVPYASPPVGSLRWANPEDPKPWGSEVYNATYVKPACPQYHCTDLSPPLVCPNSTDEDCLYLEIFAPKGKPSNSSGWPVMVYIHGGNFVHMSGASGLFDGSYVASTKEVILVNMDYRMGALGFLVTGETSKDATGNYGILDQQQALKWVMENIQSFGGDNSRITLYGQSAGAQSTLIHLTIPSSAPYYHRAIVESSPIAIPFKRFPEAILIGGLFAELVGCTPRDMNCLRSKTANEIAYAQFLARKKVSSLKLLEFFEPWGPFVDGTLITGEPLEVIRTGQFQKKPIIIGTTREETVLYIYSAWNSSVDNLKYGEAVTATYPGHVLQILYMYPPSYPSDERDEMVRMSTDLVFACPTRNATRIMGSFGLSNVWMYVWDHAFSFPGWGPVFFCEGRVCHGSEIVYFFHTAYKGGFKFTPAEEELSKQIIDFWTNFAKTADPNNPGIGTVSPNQQQPLKFRPELLGVLENGRAAPGPRGFQNRREAGQYGLREQQQLNWPKYSQDMNWPAYRFQTPESSVDANYHGPYCDFWDTVGYDA